MDKLWNMETEFNLTKTKRFEYILSLTIIIEAI